MNDLHFKKSVSKKCDIGLIHATETKKRRNGMLKLSMTLYN